MSGILPDFESGDVLRAADLQELRQAVAVLGAGGCGGGAGVGCGGGVLQESVCEGWPFEVFEAGGGLFVMPGRVLVGYGGRWHEDVRQAVAAAEAAGEPMRGEDVEAVPVWCCLEKVTAVEGFDMPGEGKRVFVYLVLEGAVECEVLGADGEDLLVGGTNVRGLERWRIKDARLRAVAGEVPPGVLRVWPLAVVCGGFEVPVTQLLWGDLSALECRGLVDVDGEVVLPGDRSAAAAWGDPGHEEGMAQLAQLDFSTEAEGIYGELYGCIDADGALELYIGWEAEEESGGENPGEEGEEPGEEEGLPESDGDDVVWEEVPGGVVPVVPPEDDDGTFVTRVRYGYVAGEGFASCSLVRGVTDGELYWELVLDATWLSTVACAGLEAPVRVAFAAGGAQQGTRAEVEMGLGVCTVSNAVGTVSAAAGLVFHGENAVDASRKTAVVTGAVKCTPLWEQKQRWFLSPKVLHEAGDFVLLEKARAGYEPGGFVKASTWYRFSVDRELFRARAQGQWRNDLAKLEVSGEAVAEAEDSVVTGVLSGNKRSLRWELELAGKEEE